MSCFHSGNTPYIIEIDGFSVEFITVSPADLGLTEDIQPFVATSSGSAAPTVDMIFAVDTSIAMDGEWGREALNSAANTIRTLIDDPSINFRFIIATFGGAATSDVALVLLPGRTEANPWNSTHADLNNILRFKEQNANIIFARRNAPFPVFVSHWLLGIFATSNADFRHFTMYTNADNFQTNSVLLPTQPPVRMGYRTLADAYVMHNIGFSAVVPPSLAEMYNEVRRTRGEIFDLPHGDGLVGHIRHVINYEPQEPTDGPAYVTLAGGLTRRVQLLRFPCQYDLYTDTNGNGIPDSQELIFPPLETNITGFITHFFGQIMLYAPRQVHIANVSIPVFKYHSDPSAYGVPGYRYELPENMNWLAFSHPESDTELFITATRLPAFGPFENALIGITRFAGTIYADIYVISGNESHFIGQTILNNQLLPPENVHTLPPNFAHLAEWIWNTLESDREDVENPFMQEDFSGFAWGRLLAESAALNSLEAAEQLSGVAMRLSSLRASAMTTPELLAQIDAWQDEWDALLAEEAMEEVGAFLAPAPFLAIYPDGDVQRFQQSIIRVLSHADGAGVIAFMANQNHGRQAFNRAENEFRNVYNDNGVIVVNNEMQRKAFRHWYWNWRMVRGVVGETNARVISTNHEWEGRMRDRLRAEFNDTLIRLEQDNPSWNSLYLRKEAERLIQEYAINFRDNLLEYMSVADNFYAFYDFFHRDDIMDFWNNHIGREDGRNSGVFANSMNVFINSWDEGRLIESFLDITVEIYEAVYEKGWWHN